MRMLDKIISIVEVDDTRVMRIHDVLREQHALCNILGNLTGNVVPLRRNNLRILVAVLLLYIFVVVLNQSHDGCVCSILFAPKCVFITVADVVLCHFKSAGMKQSVFHHILYLFDVDRSAKGVASLLNIQSDLCQSFAGDFIRLRNLFVGAGDSPHDLARIKVYLHAVSLNYFQPFHLPLLLRDLLSSPVEFYRSIYS